VGIEYVKDQFGCAVTGIERGSTAEAVGTVHIGDYLWMVDKKELKALPNEVCDCIYVEFVTLTRHRAH